MSVCILERKGYQTVQGQEEKRWSFWSEEAEREAQRGAGDRGNTQTGYE